MKETEVSKPIPEGLYKAKVTTIEEGTGGFGDYFKFIFEITEGEQKGVTRSAIASKKLSKSMSGSVSKLFGYFKALTKAEPKSGESVDIDQLIGKECHILVKNGKEKDGVMFQDITEVMPI